MNAELPAYSFTEYHLKQKNNRLKQQKSNQKTKKI